MISHLRFLLALFTILSCTTIASWAVQGTHGGVVFEKTCVFEGETHFWADFNAAKSAPKQLNQFNSAESLIQNAGSLTRLKGGVKMGTVTGDGEAIFKAITNGGETLPSGYVKMADGTTIGKHIAGSTGQFTIDVNQAGQIIKIRVNP